MDAVEANDGGWVNLADPIAVLGLLLPGGGNFPSPGLYSKGPDPTPDDLEDELERRRGAGHRR